MRSAARSSCRSRCRPIGSLSFARPSTATIKDAQFLAETQKLDLPVEGPIAGPEAEQIVASIYAASPAVIARAQAIVGK